MCLPNFIEFKDISEAEPLIGYRVWKNPIDEGNLVLHSEFRNYIWKKEIEGPHEVTEVNSGIYAYNYNAYNYNNYNYNKYNKYNKYSKYDKYSNYNNYIIIGIIFQWGKIAIHNEGQRSEYAKINKLFTIKESNAIGPINFLNWIVKFNNKVSLIANIYNAETIHLQDFVDENKVLI